MSQKSFTNQWGLPRGYSSMIVTKHQGGAQCFAFPKGLSHTQLQVRRALSQPQPAECAALLIGVDEGEIGALLLLVSSNAVANTQEQILGIQPYRSPFSPKTHQTFMLDAVLSLFWFLLLFKAALGIAEMSHCLCTAARVTKNPREVSPPECPSWGPEKGSCQEAVRFCGPCKCVASEGRHPGKTMHCWAYKRNFWLLGCF